ncbi:Tyrosinase-like protein 8 [Elsinoe fawcettii]|nr:Tyrosinase-like protein 8 [Elsinoe fawcettii]
MQLGLINVGLFAFLLRNVVAVVADPHEIRWKAGSTSGTDKLAAVGLSKLIPSLLGSQPKSCNLRSITERREWHTFNKREKLSYISAVKCLQSKPSQIGQSAPGAKSRYDDFVAIVSPASLHIQQTGTIHATGNFLSWHRYFTWSYEQALRNECGYKGYQPYLNWGKVAADPLGAPIFDGSPQSLGGDGVKTNYTGIPVPRPDNVLIRVPPGNGGGCITSGPFHDMRVNLGPVLTAMPDVKPNPSPDGLQYNPRCLRRDINPKASASLYDRNTSDLIQNSNDIAAFQNSLQGDFPNGLLGVHAAGHFLVGGDPGSDTWTSPGDPYFFLHHAQIDRVWWIWQNQDLANRKQVIAGTITLANRPPSRAARLDDVLSLGILADNITISDAVSTTEGPFCYIYR